MSRKAQITAQLQDIAYVAAFSATGLTERERRLVWGRLCDYEKWKLSHKHKRGRGRGRGRAKAAAAVAAAAAAAAPAGGSSGGAGAAGGSAGAAAGAGAGAGAAAAAHGDGHGGADVLPQVRMDVARALHWDECRAWSPAKRAATLQALALTLDAVFPAAAQRAFPFYVQGCHDVAGVLLLALGAGRAGLALGGLVRGPLRGCVQRSMDVPCALLGLLPRLLHAARPALADALEAASPAPDALPHYALPWLLTWFAHSVPSLAVAQRLFDAFVLAHPLLPLYAAAALVALPGSAAAVQGALAAAPGDEGALFQALAGLPGAALAGQAGATALLAGVNELYAALPPGALLGPWGGAGAGAGSARAARHGAALEVLRTQWPEVLRAWEPPGGVDPRLPGGGGSSSSGGGGGWQAAAAAAAAVAVGGGGGRARAAAKAAPSGRGWLLWVALAVGAAGVALAFAPGARRLLKS